MSDRLASPRFTDNDREGMEERLARRRARYAERLGANTTIEVERTAPHDTEEWRGIGKLRAESYVKEHGYLTEEALDESGLEYDDYDMNPDTVHIYAKSPSGEVVGYVRILTKGQDGERLLPAEKAFGTQLDDKAVEISRLISSREFPGGPLVTLSLIRAVMHELNARPEKYGEAVATLEPFLALHLDNMGIPIKTLMDIQETPEYHSDNMLVAMDYGKIVESATAMDSERKFSPVYPEKLGPWFAEMSAQRGLGIIKLTDKEKNGKGDDMTERQMPDPQRFDRNLGFMTKEALAILNNSTVAIAGTGGDGGELAVKLARMGVRKFRLADPEVFDLENLNRQEGSNYRTVGRNKAEVIAETIREIHPDAEIDLFTDGVTEENVTRFIDGSDVVIDETEYTAQDIGVMIAREARKNELPVFMGLNIGHGGQVTMYPPEGKTFEEHLGLDPNASLEDIRGQDVSIDKWLHRLPKDADMATLKQVTEGNISAPSVVTGVGMAAGMMTAYVSDYLIGQGTSDKKERKVRLKRLEKINADKGRSLFMTAHGEREFITNRRISLGATALRATVRGYLGLNPKTHYTK